MDKDNLRMPDPSFDWDQYRDGLTISKEERETQQRFYEETLSARKETGFVTGIVKEIIYNDKTPREVLICVEGYKSYGVIAYNEFRYNKELKVGDEVELFVLSSEGSDGAPVLSHDRARKEHAWEKVMEAFNQEAVVLGHVKSHTKGGLLVDIFGFEAFLPGSQIDIRPVRDYDIYVDKTMEFKIVKITEEPKNAVVSHKVLIEAEQEKQKRELISKLVKGDVLEGTVKNILPFGVFVDLGGIDGLIHITDLAWHRIGHPSEVVQMDEKINVVVLEFDEEKNRIALGLKQLTSSPWDSLDANLAPGDILKGTVEMITDYGAFVQIAPGIEGLIHVSEMSWTQHLRAAGDFLEKGQEVEAVILSIDRDEHKMSLGLKQLKPDPWADIETKFPVGSHFQSKVRNFSSFGAFVELEEGVDGLVHSSDLSWTHRIKHPSDMLTIGSELEVVVLDIDKENRRLTLGHKQIQENPWDGFEQLFTVGSVHEGEVVEASEKVATILMTEGGVEAMATQKHLVKADGSKAKAGEKLEFKVMEFDKQKCRIVVSHTRTFEEPKQEERKESKKAKDNGMQQAPLEKATLGDFEGLSDLLDEFNK